MTLKKFTLALAKSQGWIGVDFDGTLAVHDPDKTFNAKETGAPVPLMVQRVKQWLSNGWDVRIFTARVSPNAQNVETARQAIQQWSLLNLGRVLPVTAIKDPSMVAFYDDRAVRVDQNTGVVVSPEPELTLKTLVKMLYFKASTEGK